MKITKPDALDQWDDLRARIAASGIVAFLDYDGTLTPIAQRPDLAVISPSMRDTLRRLAIRWPTAIVTGRGLEQIRRLVHIPELTYAGSHGFDIQGPDVRFQIGQSAQDAINSAFSEIQHRIGEIRGVLIENKLFSVAVHFRLVPPECTNDVIAAARAVASEFGLRVTTGKKVVELRPDVDWNKGTAVRWLAARHPGSIPLFIGDDTTDEDAFRAIREDGIGILVAATARETAANYMLRDVGAVEEFLQRLCEVESPGDAGGT